MKNEIRDSLNRRLSGFQMDERAIQQVLKTARGEEPMKKKISLGLVLALVLLMVAAIAVAAELGGNVLSDMYKRYFGVEFTQEGQDFMQRDKPVHTFEFADVTVVIQQAVADERQVLCAATFIPKEKANILLAMEGTTPEDAMVIAGDLNWKETYEQAVQRTGGKMKNVAMEIKVEGLPTSSGHAFESLDEVGQLHMVIGSDYVLKPGTVQATIDVIILGAGEDEHQTSTFPLEVAALKEKAVPVNALIPGSKVMVDEIKFLRSPITLYFEMTYHYDKQPGDSFDESLPPRITFINANGDRIDGGTSHGNIIKVDGKFVDKGSLNLKDFPGIEDFPNELWLNVEGIQPNTWHGTLFISN